MSVLFFTLIITILNHVYSLPNFVIFLADDLGYGDVGCFGNSTIKTPNIDKLAENGVKLTHHLTAAAVCTPSRAALLTGRYPIRSGMESSNRNKVFFFVAASGGLPNTEITFAKAVKNKGYSTALIGKWHLGNDCSRKGDGCHHPLNHGFDYFYGLPLSNFKDFGDDGDSVITTYVPNFYSYVLTEIVIALTLVLYTYKKYRKTFIFILITFVILPIIISLFLLNLKMVNGILMQNMAIVEQPVKLQGLTQRFVTKAKSFLQNNSHKPFMLFVSFVHVHTALFCANEFKGHSAHGDYGDNVEEMDWAVGKIMNELRNLKILNDTFVYFSSDNGAHVEEVGKDGKREGGYNGIFRGGKTIGGMEGGIRVPSIISWPGETDIKEINSVTSQMDIFPTILEISKVTNFRRSLDGISLVSLLKQKTKNHHDVLFHYCGRQIHAATYIPEKGDHIWKVHWATPKLLPGTDKCPYVCHCFGNFIEHHSPPLLYDLAKDPSESNVINIISNEKYTKILDVISKLRQQHKSTIHKNITDQFSFTNTVWKPWLQPCCNFPYCQCSDPEFSNA